MGHGYKIPTIKASENPMRSISKIVKCNKCKNWDQGCDLDGDFRRYCKLNNYIHFKPKEEDNNES